MVGEVVQLPYQSMFEPRDKYRERREWWMRNRGWETRPLRAPPNREEIAEWQEYYDRSASDLPLFTSLSGEVIEVSVSAWNNRQPEPQEPPADDRRTAS